MTRATAIKIDGRWCCHECRAPVEQAVYGGKKRAPPTRCHPCRTKRWRTREPIQQAAASAVAKAVRLGQLPRIKTQACVDCGAQAEHYDHRDYSRPLAVEPTCRKCNFRRGPALVWAFAPAADAAPERAPTQAAATAGLE